ncbi:MAG: glutathione peroxidase [Vicinamibacterales bacterium]
MGKLTALTVAMGLCGLGVILSAQAPPPSATVRNIKSFYDIKTKTLTGKPVDLAQYRGQVNLVVNVASKCGYTPQYTGLEKLYREMHPKGFNILGFPSNDFGGQEPGSAEEIQTFCKLNYDVSFPLFEKVVTRLDPAQSPVYGFLWRSGFLPAWNFSKYIVDKNGQIAGFFPSNVTPDSPVLREAITKALAQ